jgi:hypothetical protein
MLRLLAIAALCSAAIAGAPSPPPDEPGECGIDVSVVPDFALPDVNPNSPTFGQTVERDDFIDRVLVIYWAQAT